MWALPLSHTCRAKGEKNLVFSVGLVLDHGAAVVDKRATVSALLVLIFEGRELGMEGDGRAT